MIWKIIHLDLGNAFSMGRQRRRRSLSMRMEAKKTARIRAAHRLCVFPLDFV